MSKRTFWPAEQTLIIMLNKNMIDAKYILDIKSIPDLDVFKFTEGEGLEIGANVTVNELVESDVCPIQV